MYAYIYTYCIISGSHLEVTCPACLLLFGFLTRFSNRLPEFEATRQTKHRCIRLHRHWEGSLRWATPSNWPQVGQGWAPRTVDGEGGLTHPQGISWNTGTEELRPLGDGLQGWGQAPGPTPSKTSLRTLIFFEGIFTGFTKNGGPKSCQILSTFFGRDCQIFPRVFRKFSDIAKNPTPLGSPKFQGGSYMGALIWPKAGLRPAGEDIWGFACYPPVFPVFHEVNSRKCSALDFSQSANIFQFFCPESCQIFPCCFGPDQPNYSISNFFRLPFSFAKKLLSLPP